MSDFATPEEIARVRRTDCAEKGHTIEPVFFMGQAEPVSVHCTNCGRVWDITGEGLEPEDHERVIHNQVIGYLKGKATAREDEAANAPDEEVRDQLAHEAAILFLAADDLEKEARDGGA